MSVADNLQDVRLKIKQLEKKYGRAEGSVTLLAVSKTKSVEMIRKALHAGQTAFGESYVQELVVKSLELADAGIEWHFIGPIQSNKTKQIAARAHWVHSIDRVKIAQRLSDQRPKDMSVLNICLQININTESAKAGLASDQVLQVVAAIKKLPRLRLRGLMAIPERTTNFELQRKNFSVLRELRNHIQSTMDIGLDTLSMGMSADLEAAIVEGATMVRIGTDIFGTRAEIPN